MHLVFDRDVSQLSACKFPIRSPVTLADYRVLHEQLRARHHDKERVKIQLAPANLYWCSDTAVEMLAPCSTYTSEEISGICRRVNAGCPVWCYEAARSGWGPRPLAEHRRVGDEAAILAPHMELVAGRFEHEPQRRFGGDVEAELVRRARGGAGDCTGKAAVDCAVQMAAQDALDLLMAGDDRSKRLAVL
jgi:hypothetical protein